MRPSEDWRDRLQKLGVRRTYRTWRVLGAISDLTSVRPGGGPSNREVADAAGIEDEGQASREPRSTLPSYQAFLLLSNLSIPF
jgi:hypothetical protein